MNWSESQRDVLDEFSYSIKANYVILVEHQMASKTFMRYISIIELKSFKITSEYP